MMSSAEGSTAASKNFDPVSALVVEPNLTEALTIVSVLEGCGFHVTVAETFQQGKDRLNSHYPDILLAEIRLAEYNGLHLVLRGMSSRPRMAALVLSSVHDPVLRADAEGMGATFVLKPVDRTELAAAVFRTLFREKEPGAAATPLRPPFERRGGERRARVLQMPQERRHEDRRRDLPSLLRLVARAK